MSAIRQDAWTDDEDLLLAETVLRHIREGSTQLSAFDEVGKTLSRTPAACGFRWNSLIRKRYENAISLAKKQRKELNKKNKEGNKKRRQFVKVVKTENEKEENQEIDLQKVISFLCQLEDKKGNCENDERDMETYEQQVSILQLQNQELLKENQLLKRDFSMMKEDYQSLIQIMDRARRYAEPVGQKSLKDTDWMEVREVLASHKKD